MSTASELVNYGSTYLVENLPISELSRMGDHRLSNACFSVGSFPTAGLKIGTGTSTSLGYHQFANGILDELLLGRSSYGRSMRS